MKITEIVHRTQLDRHIADYIMLCDTLEETKKCKTGLRSFECFVSYDAKKRQIILTNKKPEWDKNDKYRLENLEDQPDISNKDQLVFIKRGELAHIFHTFRKKIANFENMFVTDSWHTQYETFAEIYYQRAMLQDPYAEIVIK